MLVFSAPFSLLANTHQDEIIVTANRTEQSIDTILAPVTLIDRDLIEQSQASSIYDLLRKEAGVQLIAVDQSANGEAQAATIARTVTVAVRPEQVASLAQAQSTGKLSLSLVGAMDDTIAGAIEVDQTKLLGLTQAIAPQQVAQAERCTIRTRRGAEVMQIEIPCGN